MNGSQLLACCWSCLLTWTLVGSVYAEVTDPDAIVSLKRDADVAAAEPGIVLQVHVKEGDVVKKGDVLFSLDDAKIKREAKAAMQEAEIARIESENDVDARFAVKSNAVARAELARARRAVQLVKKSVSKSELDELRLQMERSGLAMEQADRDLDSLLMTAELQEARAGISVVRLKDMQVRAPFDGVVVELQKQLGEWAGVGEPMARVIQLDRLRVEGLLDGGKYGADLMNKPTKISVTLPSGEEREYTGKVAFVSPLLDPDNGLITVWAEMDNEDGQLRPGMRGTLAIED